MRKAGFCMLILITWYLAGMYRAPALMALSIAQLMLFIGLFVLSRYLAGGVKLRIPDAPIRVRKRAEDGQGLYVENTGKLPAAFLLRLKYCYPESTEKKDREHCGELGWRETVERGERITPQLNRGLPWCGVAELSIDGNRSSFFWVKENLGACSPGRRSTISCLRS